ncbi:hypothetical protein ABWH92_00710 [Ahrensia marina]|uniref:hypothetical protein n=1 Tax=Ahrensia marina TaxID=1514904 RepID=UPI0035CF3CAE
MSNHKPWSDPMTRMFLTTVFSMTVLAAFVLVATFDQGAQASTNSVVTGADVLAAMTAPATN